VKKYCEDNENISKGVGGGLTCEDFGVRVEKNGVHKMNV